MFVSSYSTYISTNTSDKTDKYRAQSSKNDLNSFSKELSKSPILKSHINQTMPIDYISNYKSFNNQQKLQQLVKSQDELNLKNISTMNNAKVAYEDNSKMFSLIKKPMASLSQTYNIDKKLPKEIQDIQEKSLRLVMVNTYLSNDKYYQVTAV